MARNPISNEPSAADRAVPAVSLTGASRAPARTRRQRQAQQNRPAAADHVRPLQAQTRD